jgi:hypothetical protein
VVKTLASAVGGVLSEVLEPGAISAE